MQQTCCQRSSKAAESKRRALGNYFYEKIWYIFLNDWCCFQHESIISKCRGDWDLCMCSVWVLSKREPLRSDDFQKKTCFAHTKNRNLTLRSGSLSQVPTKCTNLDFSLLYILISKTYGKFARKNKFLALGVHFLQTWTRAGRDHFYITTDESFRFHNKNSMKCLVNWIPLRIFVRSRNTQPHLNEIN